jgi:hypothetical protein
MYKRAKEFAGSITAGEVVVKHANEDNSSSDNSDIPF